MLRLSRPRRFGYAHVVSTLALMVALGGTSYAAVQLTKGEVKSRHIAKNAVTSSKIKNGTVKPKDLAASSKQRVWSSVHRFAGGNGTPELTGSFVTLHTLEVPAGTYLVTAAAEFENNAGVDNAAICDVFEAARYVVDMPTGYTNSLGGQVIVTKATAGTIELRCIDSSNVVDGVTRRDSSLTALKVHQATQFPAD